MKIGLVNIDSKYPNLALMKISAWHKQNGDEVKFWNAFETFDKIYGSKIFQKSSFPYIPKSTILGGSGIDLSKNLPDYIEHIYPDYELFKIDYAVGFLTRGCINKCPFCIVPQKEGALHKHAELEEFWKNQKTVQLLDNSLTDYKHAKFELEKIRDKNLILDLQQGFNVRTIKPDIAKLLSEIKPKKQWRIAWDNIKEEKQILHGIEILNQAGIKNYKIMCYVLTGYNSSINDDLHRVNLLDKLGLDPFVMMYKYSPELSYFTKWCNRPQIRHSCSFEEFIQKKGVMISGI